MELVLYTKKEATIPATNVWENWKVFKCNIPNINPFIIEAVNIFLYLYPSNMIPLIKTSSIIAGVKAVKIKVEMRLLVVSSKIIFARASPKR
ncbi:hypothetical protein L0P56_14190 [Anaerosalibacter bizertensis]|nr:hypothetical protein [Anaerosalibacter bizertensis]